MTNTSSQNKKLRILCIGNSYIQGIEPVIKMIEKNFYDIFEFDLVANGGYTLAKHSENEILIENIKQNKYDVVVLQEQSQLPALKKKHQELFYQNSKFFNQIIKAGGNDTAFFITWGRCEGDKESMDINPDFETMQNRLNDAYTNIAEELDSTIIPIGPVWADIKNEDLNLWKSFYQDDGSHPTLLGAYPSALTFLSVLLKISPEDLGCNIEIEGLTPAYRKIIHKSIARKLKLKGDV